MPTCAPVSFFVTPVPARLKISYLQSARLTLITIPLVAKNFFINISPFFLNPALRLRPIVTAHSPLNTRFFCRCAYFACAKYVAAAALFPRHSPVGRVPRSIRASFFGGPAILHECKDSDF